MQSHVAGSLPGTAFQVSQNSGCCTPNPWSFKCSFPQRSLYTPRFWLLGVFFLVALCLERRSREARVPFPGN